MSMCNPPHPSEFIQEIYMEPFGINGRQLAAKLDVATSTLNLILKGRSGISSEMALRLSKTLGRSPESWLMMKDSFNLFQARQTINLEAIQKMEFEFIEMFYDI